MIRMNDLIRKKRDGLALGADEIRDMIASYTCGDIPDYQMSAMMMAIYFNGMNRDETLALTLAMRDSGDTLDLSGIFYSSVLLRSYKYGLLIFKSFSGAHISVNSREDNKHKQSYHKKRLLNFVYFHKNIPR